MRVAVLVLLITTRAIATTTLINDKVYPRTEGFQLSPGGRLVIQDCVFERGVGVTGVGVAGASVTLRRVVVKDGLTISNGFTAIDIEHSTVERLELSPEIHVGPAPRTGITVTNTTFERFRVGTLALSMAALILDRCVLEHFEIVTSMSIRDAQLVVRNSNVTKYAFHLKQVSLFNGGVTFDNVRFTGVSSIRDEPRNAVVADAAATNSIVTAALAIDDSTFAQSSLCVTNSFTGGNVVVLGGTSFRQRSSIFVSGHRGSSGSEWLQLDSNDGMISVMQNSDMTGDATLTIVNSTFERVRASGSQFNLALDASVHARRVAYWGIAVPRAKANLPRIFSYDGTFDSQFGCVLPGGAIAVGGSDPAVLGRVDVRDLNLREVGSPSNACQLFLDFAAVDVVDIFDASRIIALTVRGTMQHVRIRSIDFHSGGEGYVALENVHVANGSVVLEDIWMLALRVEGSSFSNATVDVRRTAIVGVRTLTHRDRNRPQYYMTTNKAPLFNRSTSAIIVTSRFTEGAVLRFADIPRVPGYVVVGFGTVFDASAIELDNVTFARPLIEPRGVPEVTDNAWTSASVVRVRASSIADVDLRGDELTLVVDGAVQLASTGPISPQIALAGPVALPTRVPMAMSSAPAANASICVVQGMAAAWHPTTRTQTKTKSRQPLPRRRSPSRSATRPASARPFRRTDVPVFSASMTLAALDDDAFATATQHVVAIEATETVGTTLPPPPAAPPAPTATREVSGEMQAASLTVVVATDPKFTRSQTRPAPIHAPLNATTTTTPAPTAAGAVVVAAPPSLSEPQQQAVATGSTAAVAASSAAGGGAAMDVQALAMVAGGIGDCIGSKALSDAGKAAAPALSPLDLGESPNRSLLGLAALCAAVAAAHVVAVVVVGRGSLHGHKASERLRWPGLTFKVWQLGFQGAAAAAVQTVAQYAALEAVDVAIAGAVLVVLCACPAALVFALRRGQPAAAVYREFSFDGGVPGPLAKSSALARHFILPAGWWVAGAERSRYGPLFNSLRGPQSIWFAAVPLVRAVALAVATEGGAACTTRVPLVIATLVVPMLAHVAKRPLRVGIAHSSGVAATVLTLAALGAGFVGSSAAPVLAGLAAVSSAGGALASALMSRFKQRKWEKAELAIAASSDSATTAATAPLLAVPAAMVPDGSNGDAATLPSAKLAKGAVPVTTANPLLQSPPRPSPRGDTSPSGGGGGGGGGSNNDTSNDDGGSPRVRRDHRRRSPPPEHSVKNPLQRRR